MPWYQGNLHCHSTNSDGDASPADVARYYRAIGMDCVAISDHNRLTGLDEYGPVLDSDFPGVPSCEFTGPKSCHVLAVDVDEAVAPAGDRSDPSPAEILQEGIDRT
ncbi:MAG: PHP domain-containing protein, partial [Spirochaetota bacterium]